MWRQITTGFSDKMDMMGMGVGGDDESYSLFGPLSPRYFRVISLLLVPLSLQYNNRAMLIRLVPTVITRLKPRTHYTWDPLSLKGTLQNIRM